MSLTAKEILDANDRGELEMVTVPEWGGDVFLRVMSGCDRDSYEASQIKMVGKQLTMDLANKRANLIVRCVCDDKGTRLFSDAQAAGIASKNAQVLDRIYRVALRINALEDDAVEEAAKNFVSDQSDDGG